MQWLGCGRTVPLPKLCLVLAAVAAQVPVARAQTAPALAGDLPGAAGLPLDPGAPDVRNLTSSERSPATIYFTSFHTWLRTNPYQVLIGLACGLVGISCAWDGPEVWQPLFTAAAAAVAASVAIYEAADLDQASQFALTVQAAAAVALATHKGFGGSQLLFGAVVGCLGAYGCGGWAHYLGPPELVSWARFLWNSAGAVAGALVFTVWRRRFLATLAPLLGGFLAASGAGYLASRGYTAVGGVGRPALLPPPGTPWTTSAAALLGSAGLDALAGHVACVLLATVVHSRSSGGERLPAVLVLVAFVALTGLAAVLGFECDGRQGGISCPLWPLRPTAYDYDWQWPLCGCTLWAAITVASAWRQLSLVQDADGCGGFLPPEVEAEYLVDNTWLESEAPGLAYRFTKDLEDKDDREIAQRGQEEWGTLIMGVDEGDGWLRVEDRYLPMTLSGVPVLIAQDSDLAAGCADIVRRAQKIVSSRRAG